MLAIGGVLWSPALFSDPAEAGTAHGHYGVVAQGDLQEIDYQRMRRGGVGSVRIRLDRRWVEPERGMRDWTYVDRLVGEAARNGVELLPFVYGSPNWVAPGHATPPIRSRTDRAGWRSFLRALVRRYGHGGSFWTHRASREPIETWQIWNEPNLPIYWHPRPAPGDYATLLRISAAAVRGVDPRAEVMLAGLAATHRGIPVEPFLARLYAERATRPAFDTAALHPYAARIGTLMRRVERVRDIMRAFGDRRTPLAITELGWASGGPRSHALVKGPRGQARMLRRSFSSLRRKRRAWSLDRVNWFAWEDATGSVESICDFCRFAGLFTSNGRAKPAWRAFRRVARADRG